MDKFVVYLPSGRVQTETSCSLETGSCRVAGLPTDPQQKHTNLQSKVVCIEEDRTQFEYVHIRITVDIGLLADVHAHLCSLGKRVLTSEEYSSNGVKHFHAFLEIPIELARSRFRKLKDQLKEQWPVLTSNADYSVSSARYTEQLASYVVKDGRYLSKGFKTSELKKIEASSYKKFNQAEYAKDVMNIRQLYVHDEITQYQAVQKLIDLRCESGLTRCSDITHIVMKVKDWTLQKDPKLRKSFADSANRIIEEWKNSEFKDYF